MTGVSWRAAHGPRSVDRVMTPPSQATATAPLPKPLLRGWLHLVTFFLAIPAGVLVVTLAGSMTARVGAVVYATGSPLRERDVNVAPSGPATGSIAVRPLAPAPTVTEKLRVPPL